MNNLRYLLAKMIKRVHIPSIKKSEIHKSSKVFSYSTVFNTKVGKYSYIGNNCIVVNSIIGNFCSIADNVIIGGAQHPLYWLSTSPTMYGGKNSLNKNFSNKTFEFSNKVFIGHDVWIGNNALIKSGISIGNGAIIGMGSIVTKNVGSYEIWAGNPARKIKDRFDVTVSEKLNEIRWWDFDEKKLNEIGKLSENVSEVIYRYCIKKE